LIRRRPLAVAMVVCFAFVAALMTSIPGSSGNAQARHANRGLFTAVAFKPLKRWPLLIPTSTTRPVMTMKKPYSLTGPPTTAMKPVAWPSTTTAPVRTAASVAPSTTRPPARAATSTGTVSTYNPATEGMGAPGSFQACVAWRESSDGTASSDVYGILQFVWSDLGFAGSPYDASLATQDAAFWKLYSEDGVAPWRPYDSC
jgi:hypothetical protein